jgi:hypothetical protein
MHRLTPKFGEDMEFSRELSLKQFLEIFSLEILITFSYILTFETIAL